MRAPIINPAGAGVQGCRGESQAAETDAFPAKERAGAGPDTAWSCPTDYLAMRHAELLERETECLSLVLPWSRPS